MATRIAADFPCHVCLAGERPRAFIDCGFKEFSFWFDDAEDLADTLDAAVTYDGLPGRAAQIVYAKAAETIRSYDEGDAADFGAVYDPPVPTVRPKFHSLPHTLKAMVWLVYIVFTVECVAWVCRALYRGLN